MTEISHSIQWLQLKAIPEGTEIESKGIRFIKDGEFHFKALLKTEYNEKKEDWFWFTLSDIEKYYSSYRKID